MTKQFEQHQLLKGCSRFVVGSLCANAHLVLSQPNASGATHVLWQYEPHVFQDVQCSTQEGEHAKRGYRQCTHGFRSLPRCGTKRHKYPDGQRLDDLEEEAW